MDFDFQQQPGRVRNGDENIVKNGSVLVSIVTAFYNAGEYFGQTFNCVENQTFPWFEWIIVDDGSTRAEDVDLAEKLIMDDPRIRMLHEKNKGLSSARNNGIREARADYILILDADDLIEPTYMEYCWWILNHNKGAAWAYTASVGFGGQQYLWEHEYDPMLLRKENFLTVTALIRKSKLEEVGGYSDLAKYFNEDWHLWLKFAAAGFYPVQSRNEYLLWYRRKQDGVLSKVETQRDLRDNNRRIIEAAAEDVICPHKGIFYPNDSWKGQYRIPVLSEWHEERFLKHTKLRILFIFPWLVVGGADKFNLNLINGLDKEKYEVYIVTTAESKNELIQKFRSCTPYIYNLPNFMTPDEYPEFISYLLRSLGIDIIFNSHSYLGYCLFPWIHCNFPSIPLVDYVHIEEWYWRNGGYARISSSISDVITRTYTCNNYTRNVFVNYFHRDPAQVQTVHIGVDPSYFDRNRIRANIVYDLLGIDKERPLILFIARLNPQKRPLLMLKVAEKVRKLIANAAFVVVGDGCDRVAVEEYIRKENLEDTVYLAGEQEEVRPFYRDAKLTLICSIKEGAALTAYESCSMGVPVVSADVGGQSDIVDDRVGALIPCLQDENTDFNNNRFAAEEITMYTDAIVRILTDSSLWDALSAECRKRIEEHFNIRKMLDFFNDEFAKLAADQAGVRENAGNTEKEQKQNYSRIFEELYTVAAVAEGGVREIVYPSRNLCGMKTNNDYETDIQRLQFAVNHHEEILNRHEEVVNRHEEVVNRHEEVVNRHEEVVNRHEEVVNRHEEVLNRHERSVNHQWGVQKWHEQRIKNLESLKPGHKWIKDICKKIFPDKS